MSDFTNIESQQMTPPFVSTYTRESALFDIRSINGAISTVASSTWTTANQARYYPVFLPWPYLVNRVFWVNGSSTSGNRCFAIHDSQLNQIYTTGSTVASGAVVPQFVTPASPILLAPGDYYFAFNSSVTTNGVTGSVVSADEQRFCGITHQAVGATTIPDPIVPATASVSGVNLCGITWTPSGF